MKAVDNEDRVFRLGSLALLDADDDLVQSAVDELCGKQRTDGGWAQLDDGESDAYATGTALVILRQSGRLSPDDDAYRRGLAYLLSTQCDDGSWHVRTRSKPIQTYFETGFPHGKDQFISAAATGWAVTALALSLPTYVSPDEP
jgi:N-acyl-D-amino-acid deacylase